MIRDPRPSRRFPRAASRRGFTFIEVLATMVLLGIVLPAVMNGISVCLAAAQSARRQVQAGELGQGKLMEVVALKQWTAAQTNGDFGPDWPEYRWTARVSDWDGSTIRSVEVTVTWLQGARARRITLSTLVYTGGET